MCYALQKHWVLEKQKVSTVGWEMEKAQCAMAKGKHVFAVNKHFVLWQTKRPAWAWLGWLLLPAKRKHG